MLDRETNNTAEIQASGSSASVPSTSIIVWNAAPDGQVTTPMPSWSAYTGQTAEEIQGWGWIDAVHPDDRPHTEIAWNRAIAQKIVYETEYRVRGKDGVYRSFSVRGVPAINSDGTIREWWGACSDLSKQRNLEAEQIRMRTALRESESRFRRLVEANIIGIILWDANGNILEANDAFLNLMGYSYAELKAGKIDWKAMTPPEYESIDQRYLAEILTTGKCPPFEKEYIHKNGSRVPVLAGAALLEDSTDRGVAFVLDLTERKQAEQALRARTEELMHLTRRLAQTNHFLDRTNQELDQFAYVVSHDLKAPLRAIANLSQWIEEDLEADLTDDTRRQMDLLRGRVHRMEALIDGLLQYSRAGRLKPTTELVDVKKLINEIVDSISPPEEFTIHIGEMPTLKTDRLGLQQVFSNLIGNAIKHHDRSNGQVWIDCTTLEASNSYEFTVRDDGPGIDPQFHDKVFTIFQTLVPRDKLESTGIGLSLVKKIVEHRGGTIQLESQPNQGATFRFTWQE